MTIILLGIGLVFVIEGLVLALAPSFYKQIIETLDQTTVEQRRLIGLIAVFLGVLFVSLSKLV